MNTMSTKNGWRFGVIILVIILLVIVSSGFASAAVITSWTNPSSNTGGSGVTSPENAYSSDSNYANFANSPYTWIYYGYDLSSIPSGAVIDGIEVNARGRSSFSDPATMSIYLSWDSGTTWTTNNDTTWTQTNSDHILGASTDNWGHSWTRDEVVSSYRVKAI